MRYVLLTAIMLFASSVLCAEPSQPWIDPLFRAVDLDIGQSAGVKLSNGKTATGARAAHTYAKPGHYIVTVSRTNNRGQTATGRLHLTVGPRAVPPKPHQLGDPGTRAVFMGRQ